MASYGADHESGSGRRQFAVALVFLVVALATSYLPDPAQQRVAWVLRASVLRPFIATQERLTSAALRARQVDALQMQLDSLNALVSTQGALADENRTLRDLLRLGPRLGPSYRAASVIRPGTPGSESMFLIFLGEDDGVREGAPVLDRHGLVGVVKEVRQGTSVGMDWTHPDFRASAMLGDGTSYGIVENRRGAFREEDRLVLNGTAYYEEVADGTPVLTSGLGGIFPRGIPIGLVDGIAEAEGRWRKTYWLRPMVDPGAVTNVLVAVGDPGGDHVAADSMGAGADSLESAEGFTDVGAAWPLDSILTRTEDILRDRQLADSLRTLTELMRERLDSAGGGGR